jgi:hypothetical protein
MHNGHDSWALVAPAAAPLHGRRERVLTEKRQQLHQSLTITSERRYREWITAAP